MPAQFTKHFVQDLTQDIKIRQCGTLVFNADNLSNVISVDLYNGTEPYSGGGTVAGAVICPDGATVALDNGTLTGNVASVTLTADCFAITGQIGVGVQVISGSTRTTVLKAIYNVELLSTDNMVDPDSRITASVTQLVADIEAATAEIPASDMASLMSGIAPTFSTSTSYVSGAYVYYSGTLYRFTADHAAGSWTGTDAEAYKLAEDVSSLKRTNQDTDLVYSQFLHEELGITTYPFEYDNNKAYYTSNTTAEKGTPNNSPWYTCKIPCAENDVFHVKIASGSSNYRPWAFVKSDMTILTKASVSTVDTDITAPEYAAYLLCNVRAVDDSVHEVTKGTNALDGKQDTLTFDTNPTENSTNPVTSGGVYTALAGKQNTLTFDTSPTANSTNPVTSGGVNTVISDVHKMLKGGFVRGAWRTDQPYVTLNRPYRVRSSDYIVYDTGIELIAREGYVFFYATLDANNAFINSGWGVHYGYVPPKTKFIITIVAEPEDTSITAEPDVFKFGVAVRECEPFRLRWDTYMKDRLHFIGHRGWRGDTTNYPENSIPAFEKGGQLGAWAIETDIWETTDGYFVCMHDQSVYRTTGSTGNIDEMTLSQVEELHLIGGDGTLTVPTFEQYLGICKVYGCAAMIEIKDLQNGLTSFANVKKIIEQYGMMDYALFIVHSKDMYDYVRQYFNHTPIQFLTETDDIYASGGDTYTDSQFSSYLIGMQALGNTIISLHTSDANTRVARIKLTHEKGLATGVTSSSWDAQKSYLKDGCDVIMSNDNLVVGT